MLKNLQKYFQNILFNIEYKKNLSPNLSKLNKRLVFNLTLNILPLNFIILPIKVFYNLVVLFKIIVKQLYKLII